MTWRVLPREEWDRLPGPLSAIRDQIPVETSALIVVEDEAGTIRGTWGVFAIPHLEGFWIDEDERRKGNVARTLLHGVSQYLQSLGITAVETHLPTEEIANYAVRIGASILPGQAAMLPVPFKL